MGPKFSTWIFLVVLSVVIVAAVSYPEPFGSNVDANNYNLTNADIISANTFRGTNVYTANIYGADNFCYQETSNVSTACGGVSTGVYANSSDWTNVHLAYDGNFSTNASYNGANGTTGYIYINYTKPSESLGSSLWTIKRAVATNNYSLDITCWNQSNILVFRGAVENSSVGVLTSYWQCYNGSSYINVAASQIGGLIFEEAMWWEISSNASIKANMDWINLENYPVACPGSGAITALNDSVTCSDLWSDTAGDIFTGDLIINGSAFLQLRGNTTSMVCNATNAGAIYYDNTSNKHNGCNSTAWVELY